MSKSIKKVWNIVTSVLVAAFVILALLLVGARVFGLQVYAVLSGSMEPTYHTGSLIYVQKTAPEKIRAGDPITFVLDESLVVATHRVVAVDEENRCFYTKGDANEAEDGSPVYFENLIGKPVLTIPYLGYVSNFIQKPPGIYIAIGVGGIVLLLAFLPDLLSGRKKEEDHQA